MFERPENVIPAAVKTWQRVLASLVPETGEEEHFQKVEKRVSVETCEKPHAGLNRLSVAAEIKERDSRRGPTS